MALEDRVKELEEELKVLKNEIQTTLLDIQEQILSHYYPSLYPSANKEANLAQASKPNDATGPLPPPESPAAAPVILTTPEFPNKYKTQTVTLVEEPDEDEINEDNAPEEEPPPLRLSVVPKTSPEEAKAKANGRPPKAPLPEEMAQKLSPEDEAFLDAIIATENQKAGRQTAVSFDDFKDVIQQKAHDSVVNDHLFTEELLDELLQTSGPGLRELNGQGMESLQFPQGNEMSDTGSINSQAVKSTVRKLLSWVDESVTVIGKDPTKQAIEMYVRAGDVSPDMRQALLRLVDSSHAKPAKEKAGIRQIIDTLGQLNDILDHHTPDYLNEVISFITEVNFG